MGILIGLHSEPRAGKDTLAKVLGQHYGFRRFSFAGPLYAEVAAAFDVALGDLESDDWKKKPQAALALCNCNDPVFREGMISRGFTLDEPLTSRCVLQQWGTEYRRHQQEDYWTSKLVEGLHDFFDTKPGQDRKAFPARDVAAVITDTRVYTKEDGTLVYDEAEVLAHFAKEVDIEHHLVEIKREGTVHTGHGSDNRFPDHMIHTTIHNNGAPGDMLEQIRAHLLASRS